MAGSKTDALMMAIGTPAKPAGPKAPKDSAYWTGKSPELRMHLEDAVDDSLSQDERAMALCKAMEAFSADEEGSESEPDTGGDAQSSSDSEY